MSGRFVVGAAILAAMVFIPFSGLGKVLTKKEPTAKAQTQTWTVGKSGTVRVTLITADYDRLQCASEVEIQGKHCAYKSPTERWPRKTDAPIDNNKRDIIQPYRTASDNRLIFLAGLWAQPEIAMRLHREPAAGVSVKHLARFEATCEVDFVGRAENPQLRWEPGQQWQQEKSAIIAIPKGCEID